MCVWQWSTPVREWKRFPRTHQLHDLQVSTHSALCKPLLSDSQASEKLLLWKQTCSTVAWVWGIKHNQFNGVKRLKTWWEGVCGGGGQGEAVCTPVDPRTTDIHHNSPTETRHSKFPFFFFKRQLKLTIPRAHKSNKNIVKRNPNYV